MALITHPTNIEEAARAVKVSARTLQRWMKLPEFQVEYRQARQDLVRQANARIQQSAGAAAAVQLKLMVDTTTPHSVRARTSQYILESGAKSLALESLEQCDPQTSQFEAKLRHWAREWHLDEEAFVRAARGHAEQLRGKLRDDRGITYETLLLLNDIAKQSRALEGSPRKESK